MISREDKRSHPVFYWSFLVLLVVCAFQLTLIIADQAEGSYVANTYNSTTQATHMYGYDKMAHTKDDQLVVAYQSSDEKFMIAHRPSTGGSWEYDIITDTYSIYRSTGIVCSSNNTLIVWGFQVEGATQKGYVWVKWPGDDWDDWTGYYIAGGSSFNIGDIAINNTDDICLTWRTAGSNSYTGIFNLTSLSKTDSYSLPSGTNSYARCEANQSGDFWIFYSTNGANGYFRDYNKTYGAITAFTGYYKNCDIVNLPNDRFGFTGIYVYGASKYSGWGYQNSHNGPWTKVRISTTTGNYISYPKVMVTQGSNSIYILGYDSVLDKIYQWNAAYNAIAATWQSSQTEVASYADGLYCLGASNSVWPKVAGISWCQPVSGQAMHVFKESGSPDLMQIWTQSVSWTPDLTTDWPSITTASLPDATFDVFYEHILTRTGGTAPFTWSILSGPGWLSIGSSNGTIYGTPDAVGSTSVEIKLEDAIPRSDQETFSLKVKSADAPTTPDYTETFSMDALMLAELWIMLAVTAICVGMAREYKKILNQRQ